MDKIKEKITKVLSDEKLDAILCKAKEAAAKIEELDMSKVSCKDMPEIFDMMKDTAETKMYLAQAKYYDAIVEAMEESDAEYGVDYDEQGMYDRKKKYYPNSTGRMRRMTYTPYIHEPYDDVRDMEMKNGKMYYPSNSNGMNNMGNNSDTSRYGYSHDEYMNNRRNYSTNNPSHIEKRKEMLSERMDDLYEMAKEEVMGMSPEEKAMWKAKISNLVNL